MLGREGDGILEMLGNGGNVGVEGRLGKVVEEGKLGIDGVAGKPGRLEEGIPGIVDGLGKLDGISLGNEVGTLPSFP